MEQPGAARQGQVDVWSPEVLAAQEPPAWVTGPVAQVEGEIRAYAAQVAGEDPGEPLPDPGTRSGTADARSGDDGVGEWGVDDALFNALERTDDLDPADYQALMDEVALALDGEPRWLPAEELTHGLSSARRGLMRATLTEPDAVTVQDTDLTHAIETFGVLSAQLNAVGFVLAREATARGLHTAAALSLVDWLRVRCPGLSVQAAGQIKDIVTGSDSPATAQIGDAVAAGTVPLHRAALVARTMTRLESSLDPDQREDYARIATDAAARPDLPDKDLAIVCHSLVEQLLHEKQPKDRERAAQALRSVTSRKVGEGLTRFTIDAPDGSAATLNGILMSALAAPDPVKDEHGRITAPDERTPTQRRFDALHTVITRGLDHPGAPPSTARAAVMLVIPFDPGTGSPTGPAMSTTGDYLPPAAAAQAACTANVTPVWVSPDGGEPLALGRTARFASPAQWKTLAVRDRGCTYPGCSAPPQWCDTHHLDHWARGGRTDLQRMTLLCGRHHTHVHQHDLTATVCGSTVTWHV